MTNVYTHEGLSADVEDNDAVYITLYGIQRIELTVRELLAMADAVRSNMEEVK